MCIPYLSELFVYDMCANYISLQLQFTYIIRIRLKDAEIDYDVTPTLF